MDKIQASLFVASLLNLIHRLFRIRHVESYITHDNIKAFIYISIICILENFKYLQLGIFSGCPGGFQSAGGICLRVTRGKSNYMTAIRRCRKWKAQLVTDTNFGDLKSKLYIHIRIKISSRALLFNINSM